MTRRPVLGLAAVVVSAFVVYALAGAAIGSPHAFADELLYFEAATSVAEGDGLSVRGRSYAYGPLYPLAVAPLVRLAPNLEEAWIAAKVLNALFLALTAVPVFLLARRLLDPWPAVAAAGLALAIPSAKYVSILMTESLAYLAAAWALYAMMLAFERPTWGRQVVALVAIGAAVGVRIQFVALAVAYVLALVLAAALVPGRLERPVALARRYLPTEAAVALGVGALLLLPALRGDTPGVLGGYGNLWSSYDVAEVLRWIVYHLANLELYLAVIPLAVAPIVLASLYRRARAGDEREAAFLALFAAVNTVLVVLVAAFNSTIWAGERLHDRPLFYLVPLWLILLFVWLRDGMPRPLAAAAVGAAAAIALPITLPLPDYVWDEFGLHHNAAVTPLWTHVAQSLSSVGLSVLAAFVVVSVLLVLLAFLIPRRLGYVLPMLVLAFFGITAAVAWAEVDDVSAMWAAAGGDEPRRWVDKRLPDGGSVTMLTAIGPCTIPEATRARYLVEFFNSRVTEVVHLGQQPDYHPDAKARVASDGAVVGSGGLLRAAYVLAPPSLDVAGRKLAEGTSVPLVLTRVDGPVRLRGDWRRELERRCD